LVPEKEQNLLKVDNRFCLHDTPRQKFFWRYRSVSRSAGHVRGAGSFFAAGLLCCSAISPIPLSLIPNSSRHRSLCLRWSNLFNVSGRWQRRLPAAALLAAEIIRLACIGDAAKAGDRASRSEKWAVQIKRRRKKCSIARPPHRRSQTIGDLASVTRIRGTKFRAAPLTRFRDEAGESRRKFP
jgi:hypothetical protein